jgi:subfamily B ATP-binding cassette protein MsbA
VNQLKQQTYAAADRIFSTLDIVPEISSVPEAPPLPLAVGHIVYEHVGFRYRTGNPVLHDISFTVEPGEVIALVGPSGSGKTTLVNLLPRFYDSVSGRITIDGFDVRKVTLDSLREQVGIVPQETMLFSGTIYDNIQYGKLDATPEEINDVARSANALEFIERLPLGFNTVVGERGARLSGGQRQRVAIARALLKNPRILILDEATSALDTESEYLVQQALERLMLNRTTFVIAHRLSTVKGASRILVLDHGKIVESGAHQELLDLGGLYARLYDMQFSKEIIVDLTNV